MIKSPLRYPGGKSRAVNKILPLFPPVSRVVSPFLGGGSIEINLAHKGIQVVANDKFHPLIAFWYFLQYHPQELAEAAQEYLSMEKADFYALQKKYACHPNQASLSLEIATLFFVLNRSSFNGGTLSSGCGNPNARFKPSSIQKVQDWQYLEPLKLTCLDFAEFLDIHPHDFIFADPPYLIASNLYGQKGDLHGKFDHQKLFDILSQRDGWILCYNNCPEIREMYAKYQLLEPQWAYGMGNNRQSRELLILNI